MTELPLLVADVYECAGALRRRGDRIAAAAGQTQARWQLLSVLSEGDWTASDAARRLGVTRQAVQRLADTMVGEGLVRPEPNPRHQRAPHLRLTGAGRRTLATITAAAGPWHRSATAGLSARDIATARRVLQVLAAGAEMPPPP